MLFREWASRYPPASSNCRHTHKPVARVWKVSSAACSSYPACESAERRSQKGQRVTRPETAFSNNVVGGKHFSSEGTARKGRAKLRVAVDVDEGRQYILDTFKMGLPVWVFCCGRKARFLSNTAAVLGNNLCLVRIQDRGFDGFVISWLCSVGPLSPQLEQVLPGGVWSGV